MHRGSPTGARATILAALTACSVLLAACGGGGGAAPTAAPKTESKPTTTAAKPATSPAASPAAASASPAVGASPAANPAGSPSPAAGASPAASPAASAKPAGAALPSLVTGPFQGEANSLNGAGATFPAPLYTRWFNDYNRLTQVQVNYQAIGSGGGIRAISDQTVDFGATDGPKTDEQLRAAKGVEILHVPTALGAVVATYNLPEVQQTLRFSGDTLAGIYVGQIAKWNDAKIAADNPGVTLPNRDIVPVYRSDGSGTTYIYTDYLSNISSEWKSRVGVGTTVSWPTGIGAQGNPGVTNEVKQNPGAIGYVELIYAIEQNLPAPAIKNQAGGYVEPTIANVTAAAAGIGDRIAPDLRASIVNAPGADSYPISGFTWLLLYQTMPDRAKAVAVTRLAYWAISDGQRLNSELGYAPLPAAIAQRAQEKVQSVQSGGSPAFPGR